MILGCLNKNGFRFGNCCLEVYNIYMVEEDKGFTYTSVSNSFAVSTHE